MLRQHRQRGSAVLTLALLFCPAVMFGQIYTSSIVGQVSDASGAAIPNAQIIVTNTATGISASETADASGVYSIPSLQPGTYNVVMTKEGFDALTMLGVSVLAGQSVRADAKLQVGNVKQSISVTTTPSMVETESPAIAATISSKQMQDLPLAQQTIDGLLALTPGAQASGASPQTGGGTHWGSSNFTVNGVQSNDIGNGSGAYSYGLGMVSLPPLSSMSEFKVEAYNTNAEYRTLGTISMITKSGSNGFHGNVYEFLQNSKLNANTFTNNALGKDRSPQKLNQFGAAVGGPIIKNKAFFFFDYYGLRNRSYSLAQDTFASDAMRHGDFSALSGVTQLYDPLSGSPFLNNQIPASRITSQAKTLLGYVPALTGPTNLNALPNGEPNYYALLSRAQNVNSADVRLDYHISDKDQLYGVYNRSIGDPWEVFMGYPSTFGNASNYGYKTFGYSLAETHTFSPTVLNEFRAAWFDHPSIRSGQNQDFDPTTLFPQLTKSPNRGLPTMGMTGYTSITDIGKGYYNHGFDWELSDNIIIIRGRHSFKAGAQATTYKSYSSNPNAPLGAFSFDGSWTGNVGWAGSPRSQGNAFADFLLGNASSSTTGTAGVFEAVYSSWDTEFFAQDTWQATSKLTLNYGVRYSYETPWNWQGDYSTYWDPKTNQLALPQDSATATFPGFGASQKLFNAYHFTTTQALGISKKYMVGDKNNWAPRLGLAYRPFADNKTVFRAGYGVYYNFNPAYIGSRDDVLNAPWQGGLGGTSSGTYSSQLNGKTNGFVPDITFSNPFPTQLQAAAGASAHPSVYTVQRDLKNAASQQWTATLEREFASSWAGRITYAGNQTHHISWFFQDFNIPATQTPNVTIQNQRPYQPWGQFYSTRSGGSQNLEQLQLEASKRMSHGLSFQLEYAWTRSLDNVEASYGVQNPTYPGLEYGNSSGIARHSLVFNYLWEIPFGRGRQFGATINPVLNAVLGGWQISGITSYRTGSPFSVSFAVPSGYTGWWGGRADHTGSDLYAGQGSGHDIINGVNWFNTSAFTAPQPWQWGNGARNLLFGPGSANWDTSLQKEFSVREKVRFMLRGDFLDAFNHFNLGNPGSQIADTRDNGTPIATAGRIYGGSGSRLIQLGARLTF
jgi:hypothetical protein